jgi:lipopolysaccharide export system permease protein
MGSLTLARYFAWRFFTAVTAVFIGVYLLVAFVDYIDVMRHASDVPNAPTMQLIMISVYRVPQIMEQLLQFSVLVGAMTCFFGLSRRMELVVARGAGMSVWQIIAPAMLVALVLGALGTAVYNPLSASMREASKRIEARIFGQHASLDGYDGSGRWVRQRSADGDSILNARQSREQGLKLSAITVFTFTPSGEFKERIEAAEADLQPGAWRLKKARLYVVDAPPQEFDSYLLPTRITREQAAENFAAPDTVGFWYLPTYIRAEDTGLAVAGYRLQYQILIARPFLLAAMVLLASSVSLRAFRFGGVPQRILMGVGAGFTLYVFEKVTGDLSKADLLWPVLAAWLPVAVGGLTGLLVLLNEEDG